MTRGSGFATVAASLALCGLIAATPPLAAAAGPAHAAPTVLAQPDPGAPPNTEGDPAAPVSEQPGTPNTGSVEVTASIGSQTTMASSSSKPIRLDPAQPAQVALVIVNNTAEPLTLTKVGITGSVVGLTFFAFQSTVLLTVAPGETGALRYPLDLSGLAGQATGLINAEVSLSSADGEFTTLPMVADVRGSIFSVYGLFGLALVLLTLLAVLDTAVAIARHRLPGNRWRRGLRLLTPGVGIGLILVFTLSATRVWLASPDRWLLVAAVFAVFFFAIGYFSPTPERDDEEYDDDLDEDAPEDEADGGEYDTAGIYSNVGPNRFRSYESSFRKLGHRDP